MCKKKIYLLFHSAAALQKPDNFKTLVQWNEKKRLQLPASRLSANKRFLNKFARMNSTVKLLTRGGRGDARLFLERDQKRDQGKSKALEISSAKFFPPPSTRKINLEFFTRANPLVVPKMVDFTPQRNARYTSGFPFSALLSFFTPTLRVCTDGRRSIVHWRHNQIFSDP